MSLITDNVDRALTELDSGIRERGIHKLARLMRDAGDECALWSGAVAGQYQYPHVFVPALWKAQRRGQIYGHRIACEWAHGPAPTPEHQAAHFCGVTRCVNPRHLRWATPLENNADKIIHGTTNHGERNPNAVLTSEQIAEIRERYTHGDITQKALALAYGVTTMTINRAVRHQSWTNVA
jgi:hypothetical protein